MPHRLRVADNVLFVAGDNDTTLFVHDRTDGRLLAKLGRKGSGPGEFRWIGSLTSYASSDGHSTVGAYDTRLGRLSAVRVGSSGVDGEWETTTDVGPYESVGPCDEQTMIAAPIAASYRAAVLTRSGALRDSIGRLPLVGSGTPLIVAQQLYSPSVGIRPGECRVALAALHVGEIVIIDVSSDSVIAAEVPDPFDPLIDVAHNGAMPVLGYSGATRYGYLDVGTTRKRFYALFSGRTMAECNQCAWFGREVHVFDWDGALLGILELDADAVSISVDAADTHLYALVPTPESHIRAYELPSMYGPAHNVSVATDAQTMR